MRKTSKTSQPKQPKKPAKRVFVGLSGGVDSSVSALLLKKAGFDVTGVFIRVWQPDFLDCNWKAERLDAMRVCATLGIPFHTLSLEKEYKKEVVDYMLREYTAGRTPNPDVMCNKTVKFGAFLKWARRNGADFIATGHYAQNIASKNGYELHISKDTEKDQSYFLWTLGQDELAHTLFPVGGMKKSAVRALAAKHGLITASKKDSQGLCFIGKVDFKDFLAHYLPEKPGEVIAADGPHEGKVIGHHRGAVFYTIGERHGFTITTRTTTDTPYYIVDKDVIKNVLRVAQEKKRLFWRCGPKNAHLSEQRAGDARNASPGPLYSLDKW